MMLSLHHLLLLLLSLTCCAVSAQHDFSSIIDEIKQSHPKNDEYTPSSTPLLVISPEFSVWSAGPSLSSRSTSHWSDGLMSVTAAVSVDGAVYRLMGGAAQFGAVATETNKLVLPCSTLYQFDVNNVLINILFTTICDDVRTQVPYGYVTFSINNTDSVSHDVRLYMDVESNFVLEDRINPHQNIQWNDLSESSSSVVCVQLRNYDSVPFSVRGDYVKPNWGSVVLATTQQTMLTYTVHEMNASRSSFVDAQSLPAYDVRNIRDFTDNPVSAALVWDFGSVASKAATGAFALLAYDDEESMDFFNQVEVPLWRHEWNNDLLSMIKDGLSQYPSLVNRVLKSDQALYSQLRVVGGDAYAVIASFAYRQASGGIKLTWSERLNDYRVYMKEISSDGDVSTIDVIYPASPFFLVFAPEILRRLLLPVLDYANNATSIPYWLEWAPHHLGAWPVCDITADEQEQMPMEESGNFFLMLAAVAQQQNGDVAWLQPYWPVLDTWANYLTASLPDPGNQLCTDDFEGPSPHNVNLALKGVVALAAYSQLLNYSGSYIKSKAILVQAQNFAQQWTSMANDGDHTRLQYNLPNTWSQKYNLLFHYILDMNLFPASVMQQEVEFYQNHLTEWGLPLDSRSSLSKTDWSSWIAAMSNSTTFSTSIYERIYRFLMASPSRGVPFSDWYDTSNGNVLGFRARPVQGGIFAQLLLNMLQQQRAGTGAEQTSDSQHNNNQVEIEDM